MNKEFQQSVWNEELEHDWLRILDLAMREDLGSRGDCTTEALVPEQARGRAAIVVRQAGVLAGEAAIAATCSVGILPASPGSVGILPASPGSVGILPACSGLKWSSAGPRRTILGATAIDRSLGRSRPGDAGGGTAAAEHAGPAVGHRLAHAPLRRCRERHAGRASTIRGRRLPAGGRWRSTPFAAGAGETIVRACSKPC